MKPKGSEGQRGFSMNQRRAATLFEVRQSSGAFKSARDQKSGRGLPQYKTLRGVPRLDMVQRSNARQNGVGFSMNPIAAGHRPALRTAPL